MEKPSEPSLCPVSVSGTWLACREHLLCDQLSCGTSGCPGPCYVTEPPGGRSAAQGYHKCKPTSGHVAPVESVPGSISINRTGCLSALSAPPLP